MEKQNSLYSYILGSIVDGQLPEDFSLPETENDDGVRWADGAMDGVFLYHMQYVDPEKEDLELMAQAVKAVSDKDYDKAEELFERLSRKVRTLTLIDPLQSYIMDHQDELDAQNIFDFACRLLKSSADKEGVKIALSLLELFNTDEYEDIKDVVRTVGLSDEFTLFAVFVMSKWNEANNEIFKLAQKVHGWGRIHALERLKPENEEIRRWILLDGVNNSVMASYSALTCWNKSDAQTILRNGPDKQEYEGIREIIRGLLDEDALAGMSQIQNKEEVMIDFLKSAEVYASKIDDYEAINEIRLYFDGEETADNKISSLCDQILNSDKCRETVRQALKNARGIELAQKLNIEYKTDLLELLQSDFEKYYYLCGNLMSDPQYRDTVIKLFKEKLPLDQMKSEPGTSLGLGPDFKNQNALQFILMGLRQYQPDGLCFIETGLQSAAVMTRNQALNVLESWVTDNKKSLSELLPQIYSLLVKLHEIEPDENTRKRMECLINGDTVFKDGTEYFDED